MPLLTKDALIGLYCADHPYALAKDIANAVGLEERSIYNRMAVFAAMPIPIVTRGVPPGRRQTGAIRVALDQFSIGCIRYLRDFEITLYPKEGK